MPCDKSKAKIGSLQIRFCANRFRTCFELPWNTILYIFSARKTLAIIREGRTNCASATLDPMSTVKSFTMLANSYALSRGVSKTKPIGILGVNSPETRTAAQTAYKSAQLFVVCRCAASQARAKSRRNPACDHTSRILQRSSASDPRWESNAPRKLILCNRLVVGTRRTTQSNRKASENSHYPFYTAIKHIDSFKTLHLFVCMFTYKSCLHFLIVD